MNRLSLLLVALSLGAVPMRAASLMDVRDPEVDPRIHFDAPKREARFTIRAIQPPVCWPD